jgi:DNA-directed RNA polymerase subunit M/transcription elongation factor TFIIS
LSTVADRKRPYNVSVDPARYRRVPDPDDASAGKHSFVDTSNSNHVCVFLVKFACSLCGNLYKWRKSLNKHWKEKHNDESPPPLDAPVTIRPSKAIATISSKVVHRSVDMMPQSSITDMTPAAPPPPPRPPPTLASVPLHHPAFPFHPHSWFNLAAHADLQRFFPSSPMSDASCSTPLDLTMKSTRKSSPIAVDMMPRKKFHRDSHSSNDEQRDSSNYIVNEPSHYDDDNNNNNEDDDDDDEDDGRHSEHASSSSPPNLYGQKLFICSICDQRFLSIETVNEHFLHNHLNELENEIAGKSPPRNTNVAQQNEEWNLSDPVNPLKCIQCDFIGRWPTELQKHAASHSTSRPFKCLVCSLTYKWRWGTYTIVRDQH